MAIRSWWNQQSLKETENGQSLIFRQGKRTGNASWDISGSRAVSGSSPYLLWLHGSPLIGHESVCVCWNPPLPSSAKKKQRRFCFETFLVMSLLRITHISDSIYSEAQRCGGLWNAIMLDENNISCHHHLRYHHKECTSEFRRSCCVKRAWFNSDTLFSLKMS